MSIKQWNAGIIRPVPVAPAGPYQDGAAPGVWTLDQLAYWQKQGLWPIAGNAQKAFFMGGVNSVSSLSTTTITYINMTTTGMNSVLFGDLAQNQGNTTGCSSRTRGLVGSGLFYNGSSNVAVNTIQYITMATSGSGSDFGDLTVSRYDGGSFSNETRGIWFGGYNYSYFNTIDYVTIATTGDATDFGDMLQTTNSTKGCSSPTRGIMAGGYVPNQQINTIQYVTIASTSNTTDFGDLTLALSSVGAASSNVRGLFSGGFPLTNTIQYVTIASTGNATDFGDATDSAQQKSGTSNNVLAFFAGGTNGVINRIDYVTIATTGNATDFGDLTQNQAYSFAACSVSHGGL